MKVKKGDFVRLNYVGRVKANGVIFDLTDEAVAKKENIYSETQKYEPSEVVLGAGHLLKGLDDALADQEIGTELRIGVKASDGFGERDPRLVRVLPRGQFKDGVILPGMEVEVGMRHGTVSSVSGGRVRIDFNHPLAGKELEYDVRILGKVTDRQAQLASLIKLHYGTCEGFDIKVSGEDAEVSLPEVNPDWPHIQKKIEADAKKHMNLEKIAFKPQKEAKERPPNKAKTL